MDLDNDGDLDLALGQIRDFDPTHVNQFSIVLVNDGTGHYSTRIELPHPGFYDGYTSVPSLTHFDVNADGFQDLLLMHERNGDTLPDVIEHTGRYVQVLVNRGGMSFVDETPARMGDQSATTPERDSNGDPLHNVSTRPPTMHHVDRDGCADLVMWGGPAVRTESGIGRVAQPFGFRPHRSERAAFPHSAPPEVEQRRQAWTGRGWVMDGVGRGKRSSNWRNRVHVRRRWLRRRSARYQPRRTSWQNPFIEGQLVGRP